MKIFKKKKIFSKTSKFPKKNKKYMKFSCFWNFIFFENIFFFWKYLLFLKISFFFWNFHIFAKDLLRKWRANISSRVEFNVESIVSGFTTIRDLQPWRFLRFLAKTVTFRKTDHFEKLWREAENWRTKNFCRDVRSDFFLDRWWRSGVIRMTGGACSSPKVQILPRH